MRESPFSYEELTPLEQCITNRQLFARMLQHPPAEEERPKLPRFRVLEHAAKN